MVMTEHHLAGMRVVSIRGGYGSRQRGGAAQDLRFQLEGPPDVYAGNTGIKIERINLARQP